MFAVNEYVIYGSNGVCQIKDICTPPGVEGTASIICSTRFILKELRFIRRSTISR